MAESRSNYLKLAELLDRPQSRKGKELYERLAVEALEREEELAGLPWGRKRRGLPGKGEPDWVINDEAGGIVAGFEITELSFLRIRQSNEKLRRIRQPSLHSHRQLGRSKDSDRWAQRAHEITLGSDLGDLQRLVLAIDQSYLAGEMVAAIEAKKNRSYHNQNDYPVHLVLHEVQRNYFLKSGTIDAAIGLASQHERGNFRAVWHVGLDHRTRKVL